MQHGHWTVEDLLKDESFINYCLGRNERDVAYWQQVIAVHPDKKELIEEAVHEYRMIFTALANADAAEQLEKFKKKIEGGEEAPVIPLPGNTVSKRNFFQRFKYAMAAAVLLLVAGAWWLLKMPARHMATSLPLQYACMHGERKQVLLPDGTRVILNAASEIILDNRYGQTTRELFLKGEAFFDVHHNIDVPFIVHTASMDVKALGTAFNVKSYNNERRTETALIRGLVEVTLKKDNNRKLLLHPEEKVLWTEPDTAKAIRPSMPGKRTKAESVVVRPVKKLYNGSIKELAWMENDLAFDDEAFEDITYQLNRWYNVNIRFETDEIKQYHFTATFKQENIEQVLNILRASKKFNYRIEGDGQIVIYK